MYQEITLALIDVDKDAPVGMTAACFAGKKSGRKTDSLLAETDNGRYDQQSRFENVTAADGSKGPGMLRRVCG